MTHEYFDADQVDEQIEQLSQMNAPDSQTEESQLVNLLKHNYRVPFLAEDHASLERARERILGAKNIAALPRENGETFDHEAQSGNMHVFRSVVQPQRAYLARTLSGLAVLLLVSILIGSWFIAASMMSHPIVSMKSNLQVVKHPIVPSGASREDVYTIHSSIVYHLDGSNGKEIWQHPVPTRKQSDPNHGGSAQLSVVNGVVYAVLDYDIYALDGKTGKQLWHVVNHSGKEYFWFAVDNGRLYLYTLDFTFSALNAADGSLLWHNTTFITQGGTFSSIHNGNLYTQANSDQGGQLYSLDGATGKVRWSISLSFDSLTSNLLVENGIVYFSTSSHFYALRERSGQRIWMQVIPPGGGFDVYLADGILYISTPAVVPAIASAGFPTDIEKVSALNAQTGRLLWSSDPGYTQLNVPITDGVLQAKREHNGVPSLAGLDPRTGKVIWQASLPCAGAQFDRAYTGCNADWAGVSNGMLYALMSIPHLLQNKAVYTLAAFNPGTGQNLSIHQVTIEQENAGVLGVSNGLLYMQTSVQKTANTIPYNDDYHFVAYRLSGGSLVWSHAMPPFPIPVGANTSPNTSQPVLAS